MDRKRKIVMAVAVATIAGTTGFVMQRLSPLDHPALSLGGLVGPAQDAAGGPHAGAAPDPLPEIRTDDLRPVSADLGDPAGAVPPGFPTTMIDEAADPLAGMADRVATAIDDMQRRMAALDLPAIAVELAPQADRSRAAAVDDADCAPMLLLAPAPGAMIDLAFDAPCHAGTRLVIRHGGLAVTALTSANGSLDLSLPAMAEAAEVTVAVQAGPSVSKTVIIPDLAEFDRFAVQWQRDDAFQLHAYEFGAGYGEPGHVSAAAPRSPDFAERGTGGFLNILGDSRTEWPLLAEVYTFPVGRSPRAGDVQLSIEAAITPETCGRELLGEALEVRGAGDLRRSEITLTMPDCDVPEGFLVLNNILPDLTIAAN